MKIAYFDCFSGVAGDMLLAALLDAGAPLEELLTGLRTISPIKDEWDIELHQVTKGSGSVAAAHIKVASKYGHRPASVPKTSVDPDGDHGHTHSHSHSSDSHSHSHSHGHSHDHGHVQAFSDSHDDSRSDGHGASHTHEDADGGGQSPEIATTSATWPADAGEVFQHDPVRNLTVISKMLAESGLPAEVKERSIAVFTALGEAEAKTHGSTLDQVHFHEVGAIDSIIDTVGVVYALHLLGVEKVHCSALPFSEGTVWTAHGILPVPAPATLRLMVGLPTCPGPKSARGELVTPTGAALVRVLSSEFGRPPLFVPRAIGIGAGTKDFEKHPNILRVIVGDVPAPAKAQEPLDLEEVFVRAPAVVGAEGGDWSTRRLWVLEANIDDMTGEAAGYLTEKLLQEGSLDVWITPIVMKKSRPAFTVHVLCEPQDHGRLMRLLFEESTTLGVRKRPVDRCALRRNTVTAPTSFGDVRVKVAWLDGVAVSTKPEYEDCKVLASSAGVPLQTVTDQARSEAKALVAVFTEEQKQ